MYYAGTFIAGKSFINRLDPRIKLAFVVFFSVVILWSKPIPVFFLGSILFFAALASGISIQTIGQSIKPLLFFIILIFFAHALFSENDGCVLIPCIGLSLFGVQEGFIIAWRFLCLIIIAVLLTMTTTPSGIIAAIKFYLRPLKFLRVPVDDIAVMIMLALRLMPVLLAQKEKIETAQRARGYDSRRSGFIVRIRLFFSLIMKVLIDVFQRADELALAMEARNYARKERTSALELKMSSSDYLAIIFFGIIFIIFIALNFYFS